MLFGAFVVTLEDALAELRPSTRSRRVPAGVGSVGRLHLDAGERDAMLRGGARWAVDRGYGTADDLERIEVKG